MCLTGVDYFSTLGYQPGIAFLAAGLLSAADAAAHITHNPFVPEWMKNQMALTLVVLALLGAIFLKGFKEAIGLAVVLVAVYLVCNIVVTAVGIGEALRNPQMLVNWKAALFTQYDNPLAMLGIACVLFPKLA